VKVSKDPAAFAIPALIFVTALVVRIWYLWESSDNPTFLVPIVDMERHHLAATAAISSGTIDPIFQAGRPYFYPLFLSAIYYVLDASITHAKAIQAVLGSITCLLTLSLGARVFGRSVGILAGLITSFYAPMIFWEAELVASGWGALWTVVLLSLLIRKAEEYDWKVFCLVGLTGALAIITRPAFLPFLLAASVWVVLVQARLHRSVIPVVRGAALLLAGFSLVAAPVLVLSDRATGSARLLAPPGGLNAYIGNNENTCKTLNIRPGPEFDQLLNWPVAHGYKTTPERPRFFYGKVREFISEEPFLFVKGLARKAGQYLTSTETPRTVDIYVFHQWSALMGALVWKIATFGFPWGVLLPLVIVGLIFRWKQTPTPIVLLVALYPILLIAIFMAGRYRIPVVPAMAILAAAGCFSIVETFRQKRWMRATAGCCLAVFIGLVVSVHDFSCPDEQNYEVEMYSILGHHYLQLNNLRTSDEFLQKALRLEPDSGVANRLYGLLMIRQSQFDRAIQYCNRSLEANSRDYVALYRRGLAHSAISDFEQAKLDFAEVLAIAPYYSQANLKLGEVHHRLGEYEAAIRNWKEAVAKGGAVAGQAKKYLQRMSR
jgi:4-amino-4-deoxy-L-arabinose transferase-like glycosyltransferase